MVARREQIRGVVFHRGATGEFQVVFELANDAGLLSPIPFGLCGWGRHHPGPLVIRVHEPFGFQQALLGVAAQESCIRVPFQNVHEFPAQVEGVLHRHIHALPRFG